MFRHPAIAQKPGGEHSVGSDLGNPFQRKEGSLCNKAAIS